MQAGGAPITGDDRWVNPRWDYPEYEPGTVVEVRIHGVGGEGPSGMTRDPDPVAIGGDDQIGFWRARNPEVPGSPGHVREVVSWGGSTSGTSRSAFWVLLLPFALFNAAGRMQPPASSARRVIWHQAVCRLLALTITVAIVGLTAAMVHDLLIVQCAANEVCSTADVTGRWLLAPLRALRGDVGALMATLGAIPSLVVFGLRFAGRKQNADRDEADEAEDQPRTAAQHLDDPRFWRNRWPAWRLRSLHINAGHAWTAFALSTAFRAAGAPELVRTLGGLALFGLLITAVVTAMPSVAASRHSRPLAWGVLVPRFAAVPVLGVLVGAGLAARANLGDHATLAVVLWVVVIVSFAYAIATVPSHAHGDNAASGTSRDAALLIGSLSLGLQPAVAVRLAPPVVDAATFSQGLQPSSWGWLDTILGQLPVHVYTAVWALVAVQVVLLLALVCTSVGRHQNDRERGPLSATRVPGNLGAPVVALLSLLFVTAVGAGLHGFVLDWLGRRVPVRGMVPDVGDIALRETVGLAMPWWYITTAQVTVALLILLALAALVVAIQAVNIPAPLRDRIPSLRPDCHGSPDVTIVATTLRGRGISPLPPPTAGGPTDAELHAVAAQAAFAWTHGAVLRQAGHVLGAAVGLVIVGMSVGVAVGWHPWDLGPEIGWLVTPPLMLLVAIPPTGVALMRSASKDRGLRRQLGALWDILTFWPRLTHPFSPPCYGERLVPATVERIRRLPPDSPVILAGHSQGSVVALAVALDARLARDRVQLVTYGSPLAALYEGFYPAVFGGRTGAIARGADRAVWHNFFAMSEPFASPLWPLADRPPTMPPPTPGDLRRGWPVNIGLPHDDCPVCGWRARTVPGEPTSTRHVDLTTSDPDRVLSPTLEFDGRVLGHSSYHRSREVDDHLRRIAAVAHLAASDGQ